MDSVASQQRPEDLVAAGRKAERAGNVAEAEALYVAAVADAPTSSSAAMALVRLLDRRGERRRAQDVLRAFVAASKNSASLLAAARQWEAWQDSPLPGSLQVRVAITGEGTLPPLGAHIRAASAQAGLHPFVYVSGFNQWAQDLLSPASELYAFSPEVIFLLLPASGLFPQTLSNVEATPDALAAERAAGLARIEGVLDAVAQHASTATLVINAFAVPDRSPFGVLDLKVDVGQRARIASLNAGLADLVRNRTNVVLLDQERVEARVGKARVRDSRLWYLAGQPFSDLFLQELAAEYMRVIRPLKGLVRKCIVLDLDNTLWGGVVGEDGPEGIKLGGNDAPGNAFYDFQLALDGLRRRGIILAICSRNNPDDVWPVLDSHPYMVLRRKHFSAMRVNWSDKASNIRELARELNIGLDSFVFLDDNPAERALVRQQVPEVMTVELPSDCAYYTETLLGLDVFESLALTQEDRARGEMYLAAQSRREFEESVATSGDLTSHLQSLDISVVIDKATPFTIPRIAQLINKTNQFNVTTKRYTEAQVRAMAQDDARTAVYSVTVSDRFGDFGLTGVAIVERDAEAWSIDSFLLSCRVLGRGVEDALLGHLARRAHVSGARVLNATFIKTAKNAPASGFYRERGFATVTTDEEKDIEHYALDLESAVPSLPALDWLRITGNDV